MNALNNGMTKLFDLLLAPMAGSPVWTMVVVSIVTSVWALLLFKAVTPQSQLTRVRDRLFGHIYEMGLYQDHLRIVGRIQWDLAKANLRYMSLTLPALIVLMVPMVLTLAQLDSRFANRPLHEGEVAVFTVALAETDLDAVYLQLPSGVTIGAGPVRDPSAQEVAWLLRVDGPVTDELVVFAGEEEIARRSVPVGDGLISLGEESQTHWFHTLLYPGAPGLSSAGVVTAMTLKLPDRQVEYLGFGLDWLIAFMLISMVAGLAIKDVLRVSI
ncbi:MAG: uncharacterized membrane protein (DUF106 family) [Candidatus Krumholzibacteriia bacterium]|jgi:uncharacterized membrane protein (DUF106 family)